MSTSPQSNVQATRIERIRASIPFWICLVFSLWLLAANIDPPRLGTSGLVPLLPAILMTAIAFILLAVRSAYPAACLMAVFLSALAVLARYNTTGLTWLPIVGPPAPAHDFTYKAVHVAWTFALGWIPLYFGWIYTIQETGGRRTMFARRIGVAVLAVLAIAQCAALYVAVSGIEANAVVLRFASYSTSPYHRLLVYMAPILFLEHAAAIWLLVRHYNRDPDERNAALILIFGAALLFVACVVINDAVATSASNITVNAIAYIVPLTVVYAIETHALFDIRIFIRRTQQYALARQVLTVLTVAPLIALAYLYGISAMQKESELFLPSKEARQTADRVLLKEVAGVQIYATDKGKFSATVKGRQYERGSLSDLERTIRADEPRRGLGGPRNADDSSVVHAPQIGDELAVRSGLLTGVLIAIVVAVLVLRVPLLRSFDRAYFREIYDAQRIVGETGRLLLGMSDPYEIARTALTAIEAVVRPDLALLMADEDETVVCLARRGAYSYRPPEPIPIGLLAIDKIRDVPDLDRPRVPGRNSWADDLSPSVRRLLADAHIRLALPLRESDRPVGMVLLGEKVSGEPYTPEDVEVLAALSRQIALALETAAVNRELLKRTTHELKERSVGFVDLVERERRLLAADLHDQTLPDLRCLLTDLQNLAEGHPEPNRNGNGADRMTPDEMTEHLRQTIANIRDIMESLRPSALEMLGLYPALENELRKSAARSRPPIVPQFRLQCETRPESLGAFEEMSVFRIVQEAVNNACRHSGATTVRVQIGVEEADWVVRVDDDGLGIPVDRISAEAVARVTNERRGNGLDNMRYRANLIGARLAWETPTWGRGTSVILRLPLSGQTPRVSVELAGQG